VGNYTLIYFILRKCLSFHHVILNIQLFRKNKTLMQKKIRPLFLIFVGLAMAFSSAALTSSFQPWIQATSTTTPAIATFTTTPTQPGHSEMVPGGTDLILILGIILVIIIISAVMWHRRDWEKQ
jgi:hypothetical protein